MLATWECASAKLVTASLPNSSSFCSINSFPSGPRRSIKLNRVVCCCLAAAVAELSAILTDLTAGLLRAGVRLVKCFCNLQAQTRLPALQALLICGTVDSRSAVRCRRWDSCVQRTQQIFATFYGHKGIVLVKFSYDLSHSQTCWSNTGESEVSIPCLALEELDLPHREAAQWCNAQLSPPYPTHPPAPLPTD